MTKYPRHLIEAFLTFSAEKNVVTTAALLGISQPALSRQLQQFEDITGEKLFEKRGRQKLLSPIGAELFSRLQPLWQNYDVVVEKALLRFKDTPPEALRIYGPAEILGKIAATLKYPYPLVFSPLRSSFVGAEIAVGELCLGITRLPPDSFSLSSKVLVKEDFQIIYPSKWKIGTVNSEIRLLRQLGSHPLVAYGEDFNFPQKAWEKYKLGPPPPVWRTLPNWTSIHSLVENGAAWAVAPTSLVRPSPKLISHPAPLDLMPKTTYYLIYKKNLIRISWFQALIKNVLAVYEAT